MFFDGLHMHVCSKPGCAYTALKSSHLKGHTLQYDRKVAFI